MAVRSSTVQPPPAGQTRLADAIGMLPVSAFADHARLPDILSRLLLKLDGKTSSLDVCRSLLASLGSRAGTLGEALLEVAEEADRSGRDNAYHNPVHSRDVGVVFANLARLQSLLATGTDAVDAGAFLAGCCAAFGHDLGHDGSDGGPDGEPFRLERIAADTVGSIMTRHRVLPALVERACAAILVTDVHGGYRALDRARREPASPPQAGTLRALADPAAREMASLLRDADVLQSAGLTPADHDRQTARLEAERGMPSHTMGARGADFFLKDVIRGRFLSDAGEVFQPRLDLLLRLNARRTAEGRGREGLATIDAS